MLTDLGAHRLKDLGRPEELFQLSAPGLQASFPQLRSLGNPVLQNNLPVQPAKFVGRSRELAEVRALIEASPLVTLTGAGGWGKTRLSLQVAAELLDGIGDGVWLAELAAVTDEEAVAPVIAAALGVPVQPGHPAMDTLLDALVPQDVLIMVDNCEHLIGACAKIADAILRRCPRAHLLATSREPLGIAGEIIYRVPSLSLPESDDPEPGGAEASEAVALFVDRAAEQGVTIPVDAHTAPLLVSICRRLDGMPLAIELAAARLRSLSLSELSDRLDQRFRLLTGGSRAALERQQTLRATVDWSYSLLSAAEQQLLRRSMPCGPVIIPGPGSCRTGERAGLAYASLGLACAAADVGDWRRAAELHGVAQSFLDQLTEPWQDLEDTYRRDSMAKARNALGGDEFDRACSRGSGLAFDGAFSLAMSGPA